MVAAASVVVAVGTATGMISALGEGRGSDEARPEVTSSPSLEPLPNVPSVSPSPSASPSPKAKKKASAKPAPKKTDPKPRSAPVSTSLYLHPQSRVLDWVRANPGDPRHAVIKERIADQPAAVWFADYSPDTVTSRVRAITAGGAAQGRVPVLVPYAIPDRDCGGHSQGGAPDLNAYDAWVDKFAAGLGSGEVIVILEPDSVAQAECLSAGQRADRFASLARAGRVIKDANPRARVYFDAGHSGWNSPATQAGWLREAGAASTASSDGIFSNVSNFHSTADEIAHNRAVLAALGGPSSLGAVIDTSRNGAGAPPDGQWCDPAGRKLGQAPTLSTGEARIDAYLWVKLPGESDGCKGAPGTFTASYAYELAR
ncbi:glycoside hydrolase family 6 protein [Streptomyces sp. 15-116A]|uniref:glycoside hydrolase family 6 protein n=1 Tax=Streptomyces sp. 15-116A TaxID=2259035 RepID=UPI0021B3A366|nr:glycoside hydrolase family 6 protein [Streptomyces sp. 15-116A]MCT7352412.1 glycoside hydrolase family 6 protein [Streptomyces sp. 15-116A]